MSYDDLSEIDWLLEHPDFEERPATLTEFLGPRYLNIESTTRAAIRKALSDIFGEEVQTSNPSLYYRAFLTGGIGIGKSTMAAIALTYLVHWTLCLKNPQKFFNLMPGSRIAFVMMSTSERQAKDVIFGDVKQRIKHSPWFDRYPYDPSFKNRFEFPKHVVIIPLGSEEVAAEGMNVLGGVIDEIDSGKITDRKVYMENAMETIENRIRSRFGNRGLLILIGQLKSSSGFAQRLYDDFSSRDDAYVERMTIWESMGEDFYRDDKTGEVKYFYYDIQRKEFIPNGAIEAGILDVSSEHILTVPEVYLGDFQRNPEKALKDLAGIPPAVGDPFISYTHLIAAARDQWVDEFGPTPPADQDGFIDPNWKASDSLPRVLHIDLGLSGDGDALGLAMGHVRRMVEVDDELKPYIVFDLVYQKSVPPGHEIFIGDIRRIVYDLIDHHGFKISMITMDGFQSQDSMQQFRRRRIPADYVSVDREKLPYFDLREAIYESRVAFPPYVVRSRQDETKTIEIAINELSQLTDTGRKVDHPPGGSKDVADAMAGVTFTLMGDRRYHRNVVSMSTYRQRRAVGDQQLHPAFLGDPGVRTPVPQSGIATISKGVYNPWQ